MLIGARIVHGLLNEANVLLLRVVLDVVQANIASWDLGDGTDDVSVCPLNELVKSELTAASLVKLVKEDLVVDGTRHGITHIQRCETITAREGRHLSKELIELLGRDEAILVSVHITEREGQESVQLTLLLVGARLHCCLGPGFEGLLVMAPVVSAPWACRERAHCRTSSRSNRSKHC